MKNFVLFGILLFEASVWAQPRINFGKPVQSSKYISLISLIANPNEYDGEAVRVIGAFRLEFEGNVLCQYQEDLINRLSKNCLWIEPDLKTLGVDYKSLSKLNGKYVLVEGTFHKDNLGHMRLFSGAITDIWRVMLWDFPPNSAKGK